MAGLTSRKSRAGREARGPVRERTCCIEEYTQNVETAHLWGTGVEADGGWGKWLLFLLISLIEIFDFDIIYKHCFDEEKWQTRV